MRRKLPIPRGWNRHVKSSVLHVPSRCSAGGDRYWIAGFRRKEGIRDCQNWIRRAGTPRFNALEAGRIGRVQGRG